MNVSKNLLIISAISILANTAGAITTPIRAEDSVSEKAKPSLKASLNKDQKLDQANAKEKVKKAKQEIKSAKQKVSGSKSELKSAKRKAKQVKAQELAKKSNPKTKNIKRLIIGSAVTYTIVQLWPKFENLQKLVSSDGETVFTDIAAKKISDNATFIYEKGTQKYPRLETFIVHTGLYFEAVSDRIDYLSVKMSEYSQRASDFYEELYRKRFGREFNEQKKEPRHDVLPIEFETNEFIPKTLDVSKIEEMIKDKDIEIENTLKLLSKITISIDESITSLNEKEMIDLIKFTQIFTISTTENFDPSVIFLLWAEKVNQSATNAEVIDSKIISESKDATAIRNMMAIAIQETIDAMEKDAETVDYEDFYHEHEHEEVGEVEEFEHLD